MLAILAATAAAAGQLLYGGTLIGQDSATQFYPWYDYLGERLRAGELPGWNPYQFGGAPFAADPQSGWTYLPAMVLFTALPLPMAVPAFLIFHLLLAGLATYALARVLKIGAGGALVAAVAYELSGLILGRSVCCPAIMEVATWAPVALLGAAIATDRRDRAGRAAGWVVAGLALSQALAAWLGQGSYYVLLALGAFIAYRTLLAPADPTRRVTVQIRDLALHVAAILAIGFGLAAASVLPRLEYVARSNLAGGEYRESNAWAAEIGGVTPGMLAGGLFDPSLHYPGAAAVILAVMAPWLARRWPAAPFLAVFGICALVLAIPWNTPLHLTLYTLLPRFEDLHQHRPERVAVVGYLAIAMLAGAAADALGRERLNDRRMLARAGLPVAAVLALLALGADMSLPAIGLIASGVALIALTVLASARPARWVVPAVLAVVVSLDLLLGFRGIVSEAPYGGFHRVDLATYYAPTEAVAFLRARSVDEPGRYMGYDPMNRAVSDGHTVLYRYQFAAQDTRALLVNNRGTLHGIEDTQGYNPVQPRRFVEYLTALNGRSQEYHDANVYFAGISSPLLDLLNVRHLVIPAEIPEDRPDLQALYHAFPTVYADEQVKILENPSALPQAWIVHDAQQVLPGEALPLLESGAVDPRRTALLETSLPPLAPAADVAAERAALVAAGPERLRFVVRMTAPGLLVVSEAHDPNWQARIDGEPAPVLVANHLFRAVPLPAGSHIVELRYESQALEAGVLISMMTTAGIILPALAFAWNRWRGQSHPAGSSREDRPVPLGAPGSAAGP